MAALKILVIPGSLRTGSFNARLAALAAKELALLDVQVSLISLADYPLPIYDGDLEAKSGPPDAAYDLKRMIASHHGVPSPCHRVRSRSMRSAPACQVRPEPRWVTHTSAGAKSAPSSL